jgi:hypothetical protein
METIEIPKKAKFRSEKTIEGNLNNPSFCFIVTPLFRSILICTAQKATRW